MKMKKKKNIFNIYECYEIHENIHSEKNPTYLRLYKILEKHSYRKDYRKNSKISILIFVNIFFKKYTPKWGYTKGFQCVFSTKPLKYLIYVSVILTINHTVFRKFKYAEAVLPRF